MDQTVSSTEVLVETFALSIRYQVHMKHLEDISGLDYSHVYSSYHDMKIFVDIFNNQNRMLNKSNPDYSVRLDICGVYYCWIESKHEEAKNMWLRSAKLNNPVAHYNLGTFYRLFTSNTSNKELVIKHYNHAIEGGIKYAYINLGSFQEENNDHEKAINCYTLGISHGVMDGLIMLGKLYLKKGDIEKAEEYFMDGIRHTEGICAIEHMAKIHFSNGNYYKAVYYCLMAFVDKNYYKIENLLRETLEHLNWGFKNTIEEYKLLNYDWFSNEYKLFCETREKKQLVEKYSKAIEGDDIQTIISAGDYYLKNDDIVRAVQYFTVAIEKGDITGIAHERLGSYYMNLQDYTHAYFHLDKSFKDGNVEALENLLIVITEELGKLGCFELLLDICRTIVSENKRKWYLIVKSHITSFIEWKILNKLEEEGLKIGDYFINVRKSLESLSNVKKFKRRYLRAVHFQTKSQCVICHDEDTLNIGINCDLHGVCYQCWDFELECPFKCVVGARCVVEIEFI